MVLASCGGSPTALKKTHRQHVTSSSMLLQATPTSMPSPTTSTTAISRYVPATPTPQMAITQFISDADFAPVQTSIQNMHSDLTNGGATLQQDFSALDGGVNMLVGEAGAVPYPWGSGVQTSASQMQQQESTVGADVDQIEGYMAPCNGGDLDVCLELHQASTSLEIDLQMLESNVSSLQTVNATQSERNQKIVACVNAGGTLAGCMSEVIG